MFWVFKLSFVVDILAFFDLATFFGYSLKNWVNYFSYHLVTLVAAPVVVAFPTNI
jgi:hypothetical protein